MSVSLVHAIIEGGQTWAHRLRMLRQVVKFACLSSISICLCVFFYQMSFVEGHRYQSGWYHIKACLYQALQQKETDVSYEFWRKSAHKSLKKTQKVPSLRLKKRTESDFNHLVSQAKSSAYGAFSMSFTFFAACLGFFFIRGTLSRYRSHVSGMRLVSRTRMRLTLFLKRKASSIRIGSVPLVKGSETRHILITGGTGSGKTNCLHAIFPQIRLHKHKAIIVDVTGDLVKAYYRPGDILLNPFDVRHKPWNLWSEIHQPFDGDSIAQSLIPISQSEQENYWRNGARVLLSEVIQKLQRSKKTSDLVRWMLHAPLEDLCSYVEGTKAASFVDIASEKTASSIRSVAASFLTGIEHLQDTEESFSIKNWIADETQSGWLFLQCTTSQRATLRPLISCWFSIAVQGLLNLTPDLHRRIWFVIDELASLEKIKDLDLFLSEARKYGGCGVLALQSPAQLHAIYGPHVTQTIAGNCATKVVFSESDPIVAKQISSLFGDRQIKELQEGISYGAHEMRDGVSLNAHKKDEAAILPLQIQSLPVNQAFLRLPGIQMTTRVKIQPKRK